MTHAAQPSTRATFGRRDRVRSRHDFRAIFRDRRVLRGPVFFVYWQRNEVGRSRLGLSVGRRLGNAVRRNRIKRVMREVFRTNRATVPSDVDIVIVPRNSRRAVVHAQVERAFFEAMERLRHDVDRSRRNGATNTTDANHTPSAEGAISSSSARPTASTDIGLTVRKREGG